VFGIRLESVARVVTPESGLVPVRPVGPARVLGSDAQATLDVPYLYVMLVVELFGLTVEFRTTDVPVILDAVLVVTDGASVRVVKDVTEP